MDSRWYLGFVFCFFFFEQQIGEPMEKKVKLEKATRSKVAEVAGKKSVTKTVNNGKRRKQKAIKFEAKTEEKMINSKPTKSNAQQSRRDSKHSIKVKLETEEVQSGNYQDKT